MEQFFDCKEYKTMKKTYEKEYFKLFGKYVWYDGDKTVEKTTSDMAEYFKNKKVCKEFKETTTNKSGSSVTKSNSISKSFYQIWSEDPQMREYKEIIFNCNVQKVKDYQFNTFTGFIHLDDVKKPAENLDVVLDHIRSLVNDNEEHFNYLLDFLAQLVQFPHILLHIILIFISEEGVGKDIFMAFLAEVIGDKYTGNTEKLELVCGKFNSTMGGKLLMIVNETDPVESRQRLESIKFIATATKMMIEGKHKDPIKTDNYCRMMFFSNSLFAFPVDDKTRRPRVFQSSSKNLPANCGVKKSSDYFTKLLKCYKDKRYQKAFLDMLLKRDISNFNPKNFTNSELHNTLVENSISPIVHFLADIVNKASIKTVKLPTTEVLKMFNEFSNKQGLSKYDLSQAKLNVELENTYKIKKLKSSGNMFFIFNIPTLKLLLETKFKYNFDTADSDDDSDDDLFASDEENDPHEKPTKSLSIQKQIDHYEKLLKSLKLKQKDDVPKQKKVVDIDSESESESESEDEDEYEDEDEEDDSEDEELPVAKPARKKNPFKDTSSDFIFDHGSIFKHMNK
jgi:hypothetical protein